MPISFNNGDSPINGNAALKQCSIHGHVHSIHIQSCVYLSCWTDLGHVYLSQGINLLRLTKHCQTFYNSTDNSIFNYLLTPN